MALARHRKIISAWGAIAGGLGAALCTSSMIAVAIGVVGSAAVAGGSMAGMSQTNAGVPRGSSNAALAFLLTAGPFILAMSVAVVAVALVMRRRLAGVAAAILGALIF